MVEALLGDVKEEEALSCELRDCLLYGSWSSIGVPLIPKSASCFWHTKNSEKELDSFQNCVHRDVYSEEIGLTTRYNSSNEVNKPFIFSAYFVSHK